MLTSYIRVNICKACLDIAFERGDMLERVIQAEGNDMSFLCMHIGAHTVMR